MKARQISNTPAVRLLTIQQACDYVGMGRKNGRTFFDKIGATQHFGRSVRFDKMVIDAALNAAHGE